MTAHGNLVAGEWVSGVDTNRNLNPSNLDDVVGEYTRADAAQASRAIAAAVAAAPAWARGNLQERADALDRIGDTILKRKTELGTLLSREEGKTLPEGIGEASRADIFKFFAGEVVRLTGELVPSTRAGVGARQGFRPGCSTS
jgi:aldehyde dehydrogenase (NAD+)